jgi:hypothetical protein
MSNLDQFGFGLMNCDLIAMKYELQAPGSARRLHGQRAMNCEMRGFAPRATDYGLGIGGRVDRGGETATGCGLSGRSLRTSRL